MADRKTMVSALLDCHGQTFASELGVRIERNTPSPLFRMLCLAMLTSAPVQADIAMQGAKALGKAGWTTPKKLAQSSWDARARTLNEAGYARVDEKTATEIADLNDTLLAEYDGDLRRLREAADGDARAAVRALKQFKGIGEVGANIFLREAQAPWPEFYPFADKAALKAADKLDLPDSPDALAKLVDPDEFPRLVAALVRTQLAKDFDRVRETAG